MTHGVRPLVIDVAGSGLTIRSARRELVSPRTSHERCLWIARDLPTALGDEPKTRVTLRRQTTNSDARGLPHRRAEPPRGSGGPDDARASLPGTRLEAAREPLGVG